jgi:hypothetical protein
VLLPDRFYTVRNLTFPDSPGKLFLIHLEVFYKPTLEKRVRIAGFRWRFLLIANGSTRPYIPAYADFHPVAFRLHFESFLAVCFIL